MVIKNTAYKYRVKSKKFYIDKNKELKEKIYWI